MFRHPKKSGVVLPFATPAEGWGEDRETTHVTAANNLGSQGTGARFLIIDDEPAIARLVERVATGCGYLVTLTTTADHFMDALAANDPAVIVLDLAMPGVDGVELLRFLGTIKCKAQILIISGFDPRVLETAAELGSALGLRMAGTLGKPLRIAELRDAIETLTARRSA